MKKILYFKLSLGLILALFAVFAVTACSNAKSDNQSSVSNNLSTSQKSYKRIVVTSPCPGTTLYAYKEAREGIVGISDWIYKNGNKEIQSKVVPSTTKLNTSFITSDFKVNLESLIGLKPDYIFYYAKYQDDGLKRAKVPTINLAGKDQNPKTLQILWENTFCQTLGIKNQHKYQKVWDHNEKLVKPFKSKTNLKVLYINRLGKEITVSTPGTTQDYYLKMAGLKNVATGLHVKGDAGRFVKVSMEQIYKWNPDMIIINLGSAKDILNNKLPGQDWSKLKAVKERKVYTSPSGVHVWGNLGADSPLMPLWLENLVNPKDFTNQELRKETKDYYKKMFDYKLSNNMLDSIFKTR